MTKSGATVSYTYNADGLRTQKTVSGTGSENQTYTYLNGTLTHSTYGSANLHYTYDSTGPSSVTYSGTKYFYLKNAQGDILGLVDTSGNQVVAYTYDAWGKLLTSNGSLASTLGKANPFRYRGYVYDEETGLYYLQSRYYNPGMGRFINADNQISTISDLTGMNLFAYCGNNPVNRCDPSGHFWITALIVTAIVATVAAIGYKHVSKRNSERNSEVDSNPETSTNNKIVNDQNGATGNNFEYGLHKSSWNGCETIAVHNAKVSKGIDSSLSETMADFQSVGAMIGYGALGSNPYQIGSVLSKEGIDYSRVGLDDMTESGTYIISFWNDNAPWNGLHTVAVDFDGTTYTTYNLNGNGNTSKIAPSIYANNFICGYYLR